MPSAAALLERAARAFPAAQDERVDGWWLRWSDSASWWWSGAVLAHGTGPLGPGVDRAERFYAERGGPARFQVCPDCPATLDAALDERGYTVASPMSLQVGAADRLATDLGPFEVRVAGRPDDGWLAASPEVGPAEQRLLSRVRAPSAFVRVLDAGEPVAVGRAVAEDGWSGVFGMATRPEHRGRGAARAVLSAVAAWAVGQGCPSLYLQVEVGSGPAAALYASAGFGELARYHYRTSG